MNKAIKYSFLEVKQKIEAWCAYQERCHYDVSLKLRNYGLDDEDTAALISHLIEYNFLNEQRFADSFVSGKHRIKKWGRIKIKMHLKKKHVTENCIKEAFKQIDDDEYFEQIKSLAQKKFQEAKGNSFEKRIKTQRFLASRGFELDLIIDALDGIES